MTRAESPPDVWKSAERIKATWRAGAVADAAAALREQPQLAAHRSVVIDLAYEEYLQRERDGAPPEPSAFARGFPDFQTSVFDLIDAHRLLMTEPQRLPLPEAEWPVAGEILEGLELRCEIGRGAFGRAYLAYDSAIGRLRVVKVTPGGGAEARVIGGLNHPQIVDVLWTRPVGNRTAVCMPFVGAATLASVIELAKGRSPSASLILTATTPAPGATPATRSESAVFASDPDSVATAVIGAKLASAIAYLHSQGVIHGDVKPSNVVLQPGGSPQVIDFNLAAGEEPAFLIRGTPAYMAPELVDAALTNTRPALNGARADVFALGVTLIEWLTGRHPYRNASDGTLASYAIAACKCKPVIPGLPAALVGLLKRSLAIDPSARPTAASIAAALDRYASRSRAHKTRRTRFAMGSLAAAVAAFLVVVAFLRSSTAMERPPETATEFHDRGLAALRSGKTDAARADFVSAYERSADNRDLALAAYCYSLSGNQDVALEMNMKAINAGADTAEVRNNRGAAFLKLSRPDDAMKELDAALGLAKDLRAARYNRAMARFNLALDPKNLDRLAGALTDMDEVVKVGPFSAELHMDAARLYALASPGNLGLADRAIEQLKLSRELGQSPAKIGKDLILKRNLAGDPRFVKLIGEKQLPVVPAVQLHFVEPFQN